MARSSDISDFVLTGLEYTAGASHGLLLRGAGNGRFEPVETGESNLLIEGQVRNMGLLRRAGGDRLIVVARNDDKLAFLRAVRLLTD